jgi:DhnA-type fructose-1,6-bisphosphate aldolase and related enzymes
MSKSYRLSRIFRPETGNSLVLPIDHGLAWGYVKGLENPCEVLKNLKTPDIDAVLLSDGIAKQSESVFYGRNTPARLLCADTFYMENKKLNHELVVSPETAARRGYDCVKVILFWDRPAEERMKSVKLIANCIQEAEKWDMPVMVEPLTFDPVEDKEERIKILSDATRIAYELGADILKIPHPGDKETLENWVKNFNVPTILLGGGKSGSTEDLIALVDEAISVGVRGVAIGRNVWQRSSEEAKKVLSAFAEIIHKKRVLSNN